MPDYSASGRRSLEPCSFCGGTGEISDAVYDVAIRGWAIMRTATVTRHDLIRSAVLVRRAIDNHTRHLLDVHRQLQIRAPGLAELLLVLENSGLRSVKGTLEMLLSMINAALDERPVNDPHDHSS
jgi:hypothetical protein